MVALLVALGIPTIASAHVLKIDGDIGAVLHINPDDNPTTGGPTDYILSFTDNTGKFSLPKCDCSVSIIENGQTVTTLPLVVSSDEFSENHFTFPQAAVYTMRFTGHAKMQGTFQPFTLDYEVRVTGGQAGTQPFPLLLGLGMAMGIGLLLLAAYAMDYDNNDSKHKENK